MTSRHVLLLSFPLLLGVGATGALVSAGTDARAERAWRPTAVPGATAERELAPRDQALHVLNRLAFGPRPGDVDAVLRLGVDRWIEQQLAPERIRDRSVDAVLSAYPHLAKDAGELRAEFPPAAALRRAAEGRMTAADSQALRRQAQEGRRFVAELTSARVARAVVSERQLAEVMTDFWLNHFSVFVGKNARMRYYLPTYERETIRPHVLGKFRDLLGAVARSPAMLVYLDNAISVADSTRPTLVDREVGERRLRRARAALNRRPNARADSARLEQLVQRRPRGLNENYARELLELHTLGVDGGYTQDDVINVARVLTGWTVRLGARDDGGFQFNPAAHDAGEKRILGRVFRAGRGEDEGDAVLDLLARHPSTARHIATKLAVRLVSDDPPDDLIDRATEVFLHTDGDIREVVRAIVTSPEFFSKAAWRAKVKSPFEVVVSAARALGGTADTTAFSAALVARLGQPIYGHQAPDGWPETGEEWMNTGAILNRINFGMAVAANRVPGARLDAWPPYAALREADRAAQVDAVIAAFLGGQTSTETRAILVNGANPMLGASVRDSFAVDVDGEIAMSERGVARRRRAGALGPPPDGQGNMNDREPRNPDVSGRTNPLRGNPLGPPRALSGLDQLIGLALGAPEFQRR
ncbi:MAG: DUF1800 domain-containing protein [Gemmatimonadaceae bacterium]|nr:DUF1800 domain-containing protein [Gemmatimonadaceae bacterium]